MKKNILCVSILTAATLIVGAIISPAVAQVGISFPVAELGNCVDKTACKAYCDKSENVDACLSFAEKNNLMSNDEIKAAKGFKKTGMTGPGGCKGKNECSTYCSGPDHMDECVAFAEKNGLMSGKKLDEAKKVKSAIAKGIKPPACGGKENCKDYCSSSEHVEECVKFAEEAGVIKKEDADMIRKNGGKRGPGGPGDSNSDDRQGPDGQDRRGDQGNGDSGDQGQQGNDGGRKGPDGGDGGNRGGGKQGPGDFGGKRGPEGGSRGGGQGQGGQGQGPDSK
jgi:hypothetical protein